MADYEKMTVANLRVLLKDRGIPSTGLTRKAQIVAKLQEEDVAAVTNSSIVPHEVVAPVAVPSSEEVVPAVQETPRTEHVPEQHHDTPAQKDTPATNMSSPTKEGVESSETKPNGVHAREGTVEQNTEEDPAVNRDSESPRAVEADSTSANRSLSQTPLPSKEEAISQSLPPTSINATPAASREDTVATTQTDTDERKKRKRRSGSPPIDTQEVAIKRAKVAEEVHLKEDGMLSSPVVQNDIAMMTDSLVKDSPSRDEAGQNQGVEEKDMVIVDSTVDTLTQKDFTKHTPTPAVSGGALAPAPSSRPEIRPTKDIRLQQAQLNDRNQPEAPAPILVEDLPTPSPSAHVATRALYIRNFMRPLQIPALKSHLAALAGSSDVDVIENIYVDSIKTHSFVLLKSLAAAARIRAGMHDQVWPKERDRKPLWVDYIPEESVPVWINTEENAGSALGSRVGGRKWEVVYEHDGGTVVAHHVEVGSGSLAQEPSRPVPTGPSQARQVSVSQAPIVPKPAQPEQISKTFIALDELFESTKAKPMLYFKPVGAKVADDRLDELDYATGKYWSTRDQRDDDELRRYTFDDEKLVETGVHHNKGRGGFGPGRGGRGGPSSRFGRGAPRGPSRGNWYR